MNRKIFIRHGAVAVFAVLACGAASAQSDYPSRPIDLVIPAAPGGLMDSVARTLAVQLNQSIKANVIIRNESAGSGIVAIQTVAAAKPDGYTIGLVQGSQLTMIPHLVKINFKVEDIVPVTQLYRGPMVLAINKSVPATNLREFVDYLRKDGRPFQAGVTAQGGLAHLALEQFGATAKLAVQPVPYRGEAPMVLAMRSGSIDASITTVNSVKQHAEAGAMRIVGIMSDRRAAILPDVPTFLEQGFDVKATFWHGIVVPKGTPRAIVDILNKAFVAAVRSEAVASKLTGDLEITALAPEQFGEAIRAESKQWGDLIKARGITQ